MLVFPSDPNTGDIFGQWQWDGNKWTRAGGGGAFALDNLTDVAIVDPMADQMLAWDAVTEKWVNSAPPPRTLANLNDVAISNPTANQLLTFNGTSWQNSSDVTLAGVSGPVTVTTPTSSGLSVQLGEEGGAWEQIKITNNNPVGGALYRAQDGNDNTASFGINSNAQGVIRTNNIDRVSVDQAGKVTIAAPNGDTGAGALNVNARYNEWSTIINGNPYGLYVGSNSTTTGYLAQFQNGLGNLFLLWNNGVGELGPPAGKLSWGSAGNFALGPALSHTLQVYGGPDLWSLVVNGNTLGLIVRGRTVLQDSTASYNYFDMDNAGNCTIRGYFTVNEAASDENIFTVNKPPMPNGPGVVRIGPSGMPTSLQYGSPMCRINGGLNQDCLFVVASNNTSTSNAAWLARFLNTGSSANASNGVQIQAGLDIYDNVLKLSRQDLSSDFLRLNGIGNWDLILPGNVGTPQFNVWNNQVGNLLFSCVGGSYSYIRMPLLQGTSPGTYPAVMAVTGNLNQLCIGTSSIKYKRAVRSIQRERAREIVRKLRTVTYFSKCELDDPNVTQYGLVAEEVAEVDRALVSYDGDGNPVNVAYDCIAMLMLQLLQELLGMEESTC